uniref:Uncharacterized protein n=1 Tax=Helianthus annuus TaxID=4232 RepID=A0A251ULT2_HELAN
MMWGKIHIFVPCKLSWCKWRKNEQYGNDQPVGQNGTPVIEGRRTNRVKQHQTHKVLHRTKRQRKKRRSREKKVIGSRVQAAIKIHVRISCSYGDKLWKSIIYRLCFILANQEID